MNEHAYKLIHGSVMNRETILILFQNICIVNSCTHALCTVHTNTEYILSVCLTKCLRFRPIYKTLFQYNTANIYRKKRNRFVGFRFVLFRQCVYARFFFPRQDETVNVDDDGIGDKYTIFFSG